MIGLQMGFADLLEPLGIARDHAFARDQIRLMLRLAAAEADVDCYDSAFPTSEISPLTNSNWMPLAPWVLPAVAASIQHR